MAVSTLDQALRALSGPRLSVTEAERSPSLASPGLYAVYGEPLVWRVLRLGEPPDDRPLYVGKSESSFQSRDLLFQLLRVLLHLLQFYRIHSLT